MLRVLHRLALAIVTLACAGAASPGLSLTALTAAPPIEIAMADSAVLARPMSAPKPVRQWEDAAEAPAVDLKAVECDDGDALCDLPEDAILAFAAVPFPREGAPTPRSEQEVDTSRFAMSTGLPRGPPV
jgi:hypothetical protein